MADLRPRRIAGRLTASLLAGVLAATAGGAVVAGGAGAAPTWPTYHADGARDGADPSEASLDPATKAWSRDLGGAVYGQPVVADGRIFAATEGNRVVALDPHSGAVLWSRSLGAPLTDVDAVAGCGDIDPLGITSTPVVDTRTNTVYVVGEVATGRSTVHHQLEGFDAFTGAPRVSDDVDPTLPAGESPINLLQRASLALGNGRVYVGFGGNDGDCGSYHGWLVGVNETGAANKVQFGTTPGGQGGAIWEPGGPAVDGAGNVYVTTGNSTPFPSGSDQGVHAESVVKLTPNLSVEASFKDPAASGDADLGTDSPTLIPGGEVFSVGKTDIGYVLRQSNLSEVAAIPHLCGSDPDGGNAYDVATDTIFIPCRGGGIQEVDLATNTAGPRLSGENSGPILVGGDVWAAGYPNGTLTEWNAANGRVLQNLSVGSPVPTFASPSAALGLLLIGTTSGVTAWRGPGGLPPSAPPPPSSPSSCAPGTQNRAPGAPPANSYLLTASDGGVFTFGGAPFLGSAACEPLVAPVVGISSDHRSGYWLVASDGGVFSFGAPFEGSAGSLPLRAPMVGMASTPDGGGYWLVASDGGVFAYGDARFHGSLGALRLNAPIVGIAATADGGGYWLVASDGGVFAFGDATFAGSMGGRHLNARVVGIAAGPHGYRLVASDGGVFDFGGASFAGSLGGRHLNAPIVGMIPSHDGPGYLMAAADGGVFAFGDAVFSGSMGGTPLVRPVVGIAGG